jgi:hypothetical protein
LQKVDHLENSLRSLLTEARNRCTEPSDFRQDSPVNKYRDDMCSEFEGTFSSVSDKTIFILHLGLADLSRRESPSDLDKG